MERKDSKYYLGSWSVIFLQRVKYCHLWSISKFKNCTDWLINKKYRCKKISFLRLIFLKKINTFLYENQLSFKNITPSLYIYIYIYIYVCVCVCVCVCVYQETWKDLNKIIHIKLSLLFNQTGLYERLLPNYTHTHTHTHTHTYIYIYIYIYLNFGRELKTQWNVKVAVIPIIIAPLGMVYKGGLVRERWVENRRTSRDHLNYRIEKIGLNTEKSAGELR